MLPRPSAHPPVPRLKFKPWAQALALLLLVPSLAGLTLRLYCTDARLTPWLEQTLSARLQTSVHIDAVHLNLLESLTLTGLRVDAPQGFTAPVLVLPQAVCRWRLVALGRGAVQVTELRVSGLEITVEDTAQGRNLAALGPPGAAVVPGAATPQTGSWQVPELPVPFAIDDLNVEVRRITYLGQAGLRGEANWLTAQGHVGGTAQQPTVHLTLACGSGSTPATWLWATPQQTTHAAPTCEVGVQQQDWAHVALHADLAASVLTPHLPALPLHAHLVLGLDAEAGTGAVTAAAELGEALQGSLQFALTHLRTPAAAALQMTQLQGQAHLGALQPWLSHVLPGWTAAGRVEAHLSPWPEAMPPPYQDIAQTAHIKTAGLSLATEGTRLDALTGESELHSQDGALAWSTQGSLQHLQMGPHSAQQVTFHAHGGLPLPPWSADAHRPIPLTFAAELAGTRADAADLHGVDWALQLQATAPTALLQGVPDALPASLRLKASLRQARQGGHVLQSVGLAARASVFDRLGTHLDADLDGTAQQLTLGGVPAPRPWPQVKVHLHAGRRGNSFAVHEGQLRVGAVLALQLHGVVHEATSAAPRLQGVQLTLGSVSLPALLALGPAGLAAPGQVTAGTLQLDMGLEGRVDYPLWRRLLAMPQPPADASEAAWATTLQEVRQSLHAWSAHWLAGMPWTAHARLALEHVDAQTQEPERRWRDVAFNVQLAMTPHGPTLHSQLHVPAAAVPLPMQALDSNFSLSVQGDVATWLWDTQLAALSLRRGAAPLTQLSLTLAADYPLNGDLQLRQLRFTAADLGCSLTGQGVLVQPLNAWARRAWQQAGMPGLQSRLQWAWRVHPPEQKPLQQGDISIQGALDVAGELTLDAGLVSLHGDMRMAHLQVQKDEAAIDDMNGVLPFDVRVFLGERPQFTVVARNLSWGGGIASLYVLDTDVRDRPARPIYYDRLRPYRPKVGVTARQLRLGAYEAVDFALEGRLQDGMLLGDWIAMSVLGGDVVGNLALQLGHDNTVRGDMGFKVSNIDASTFPALDLAPGTDSELSADMRLSALFGNRRRDITFSTDITKIGAKALDRFLQLLDPSGKDAKLQQTRGNLRFVRIRDLALWVRYENLNMDITYDPLLRLPFTDIGYRPIERELLRRYAVGESLDVYLQPWVNRTLSPLLGWSYAG